MADHSIDLRVSDKNLLGLSAADAKIHLEMLGEMLFTMRRVLETKLTGEGGSNKEYLDYIYRLYLTVEAVFLKNRLESERHADDVRIKSAIDPTDSGFPVFVRDLKFLTTDIERAESVLAKMPEDKRLVDDALFLIFRGLFPKDVILQKLEKEYYSAIQKLTFPERLKIHPHSIVRVDKDAMYCMQSFERLDDHSNIPRFYTIYFRVPSKSFNSDEWKREMKTAIPEGLSTVTNLELGFLAKEVEEIEGVQVEYIERFDVGPFFNRFTENTGAVGALIESDDDYLMTFRKYSIVRSTETKREGFRNWWKGLMSGDDTIGEFSPAIASPLYCLMPHRLVQRAHARELPVTNIKMFGITSSGDIYE